MESKPYISVNVQALNLVRRAELRIFEPQNRLLLQTTRQRYVWFLWCRYGVDIFCQTGTPALHKQHTPQRSVAFAKTQTSHNDQLNQLSF